MNIGEVTTFELIAKNISSDEGILAFETLIDYDANMLELEIINDANSEWNKTSFYDNYLIMNRNDLLPSNKDQIITKINIKAKEDSKPGIYRIKLKDSAFLIGDTQSLTIPEEIIEIQIR